MQPNQTKNELVVRPKVLEGEVSDGRLDALLAGGMRLDQAIYQLIWERMNAKFEREIFKDQCFIPGANPELDVIDLE